MRKYRTFSCLGVVHQSDLDQVEWTNAALRPYVYVVFSCGSHAFIRKEDQRKQQARCGNTYGALDDLVDGRQVTCLLCLCR
jgi:hypothetical protein